MKRLKMFGPLIAVVASLMVFTADAYAERPVLTSPAGTPYTGFLAFTATESMVLNASVFTVTCTESLLVSSVTSNFLTASGWIETLTFKNCNATVNVYETGRLQVQEGGPVSISGTEITVSLSGISCIYGGGSGTRIGTLAGGTTATLAVSAELLKLGGSFLCASRARWTAKYVVTTPDTLLVD